MLTILDALRIELHWTHEVLAELQRTLTAYLLKGGFNDGAIRVAVLIERMSAAFPEALLTLDPAVEVGAKWPDVNDVHVVKGVVGAKATHLVTENIKHFPLELMRPLGVTTFTADKLLQTLLVEQESKVMDALGLWLASRSRPTYDQQSLIQRLHEVQLPTFVGALASAWR